MSSAKKKTKQKKKREAKRLAARPKTQAASTLNCLPEQVELHMMLTDVPVWFRAMGLAMQELRARGKTAYDNRGFVDVESYRKLEILSDYSGDFYDWQKKYGERMGWGFLDRVCDDLETEEAFEENLQWESAACEQMFSEDLEIEQRGHKSLALVPSAE